MLVQYCFKVAAWDLARYGTTHPVPLLMLPSSKVHPSAWRLRFSPGELAGQVPG
jgi:hypothetical protein